MPHQLVFVLIENPIRSIPEQVEDLLAPHRIEFHSRTFKDYFQPQYWRGQYWNWSDLEQFLAAYSLHTGEHFERDDRGWFRWTRLNPEGQFDYYQIGGLWDGYFPNNMCTVRDLPAGFDPGSIVTPDGHWHFFRWRLGGEPPLADDAQMIQVLWQRYANYTGIVVDAHV